MTENATLGRVYKKEERDDLASITTKIGTTVFEKKFVTKST